MAFPFPQDALFSNDMKGLRRGRLHALREKCDFPARENFTSSHIFASKDVLDWGNSGLLLIREVSVGAYADGVKFPIFSANCSCLLLYTGKEKRRQAPQTPSTPSCVTNLHGNHPAKIHGETSSWEVAGEFLGKSGEIWEV